jgi:hypothetical protein
MTDKPVTQEEYDRALAQFLSSHAQLCPCATCEKSIGILRRARVVVVPEGRHVYTSKFKPVDMVRKYRLYLDFDGANLLYDTREEALAEYERRNKEATDDE